MEVLLEFIQVVKTFAYDEEGMSVVVLREHTTCPCSPPPTHPHTPHPVSSPLLPHKDSLTTLLLSAVWDSRTSIKMVAIATIAGLLDLEGFLDSREVCRARLSVCLIVCVTVFVVCFGWMVGLCPPQLCLSAGHLKTLALSDVDATVR